MSPQDAHGYLSYSGGSRVTSNSLFCQSCGKIAYVRGGAECRTCGYIKGGTWLFCQTHNPKRGTNMGACPSRTSRTCSTCSGTGKVTTTPNCTSCAGTGRKTCSSCSGSGTKRCGTCNGQGTTTKTENCSHGRGPNSSHYHCSSHGNDVNQYH